MKKKKENNKKILIPIIVLILIIICIVTVIVIKNQNKSTTPEIMGIYDKTQDEVPHLKYSNLSEISTIMEDSEEIEIAKKFRNIFENDIPKLKNDIQDFSAEEINDYYEENQKEIKQDFYYIEKEDFELLCNKLKEMTSNLEQDFDVCDFKSNGNNKIEVTCSYKNEEKITFMLSSNKKLEYKEK